MLGISSKMSEPTENPKVPRRLAAILAADVAGYSALMGADEADTVRNLKEHQAVVLPMIKEHGGRIIDTAGDGILAEFGSVVSAAECAVARPVLLALSSVPQIQRLKLMSRVIRASLLETGAQASVADYARPSLGESVMHCPSAVCRPPP
jgi:class 3 adenylate cyclase